MHVFLTVLGRMLLLLLLLLMMTKSDGGRFELLAVNETEV